MAFAHELLHCCHIWRVTTLESVCRAEAVRISSSAHTAYLEAPVIPSDSIISEFLWIKFTKVVEIRLDSWRSAFDGNASKALLNSFNGKLVFPHAHTLNFVFNNSTYNYGSCMDLYKQNASRFANDIRYMVPNMRRVVLSCDRLDSSSYRDYKQPMTDSVCSSLCQGIDQISVDASYGGFPFALSAGYLPGITRIKYCLGGGQEKTVFELIRRSATTLRLLDIYRKCNGINGDEVIGLVQDETGHATVYPVLEKLGFNIYHCFFRFFRSSAIPNLGQVTLFPNLKVLCTSRRFYHYDDILLKGNFGTLEYLSLSLSPDLVSNLEECRTFTTNSHPRLRHLQLYNRYNPRYLGIMRPMTQQHALHLKSSAQHKHH
ncbi:hypothetical protein LPJ66_000131 [Kickxella alabastrina]|uniref:Uncharacterized protein n=1 Tax=Kickxella alabastrina TaxID=61397 RepID=A0ACC1IWX2_9FUNG|nr:hypothetical protein LPJ66_000131 [Kickxella alabastrina]